MLDEQEIRYANLMKVAPEDRSYGDRKWLAGLVDPVLRSQVIPSESLEHSRAAYDQAILSLYQLTENHMLSGMADPADFSKKLEAKVKRVDIALKRVQTDLIRIQELENVEWFGSSTHIELRLQKGE